MGMKVLGRLGIHAQRETPFTWPPFGRPFMLGNRKNGRQIFGNAPDLICPLEQVWIGPQLL